MNTLHVCSVFYSWWKIASVGPIGIKWENNVRPMVFFYEKNDCSMFICTSPIFAIYFAWFLMMYSKIHWISCFDGCINICNQLVCLYAVFDCMRAEYFILINNLIELYFMYEFRFNGTFLKKSWHTINFVGAIRKYELNYKFVIIRMLCFLWNCLCEWALFSDTDLLCSFVILYLLTVLVYILVLWDIYRYMHTHMFIFISETWHAR